jgi:hypothetical protein
MEFKKAKIVVTVPETHADAVRKALGDAGAGVFGNYSHCSITTTVTGRWLAQAGANPHVGEVGKMEQTQEEKIEVVCSVEKVKEVIDAAKKVHPYDQPTFDVYPLLDF